MEAKAYKYIAAWGKSMGSDESYIKTQQEIAAHDNAPYDSIYRDHVSKVWRTINDVKIDSIREYIRWLVK